jgi:acetyl/propionyl-CoA carboxylase alpha subunit
MIAKLIVYDENRERAIQKMLQVLKEIVLFGVKTNIPYLAAILGHAEFQNGKMTTKFLEKYFPEGITEPELSSHEKTAIEKLYREVGGLSADAGVTKTQSPWLENWKL